MADIREMGFEPHLRDAVEGQVKPVTSSIKTVTRRMLQHASRKEDEEGGPGFLRQVWNEFKIRTNTRLRMYFMSR